MMGLTIWWLTICWLHWSLAADVVQTPRLILASPGDTVSMNCSHEDSSQNYKYWYQQQTGQALQLLGYAYRTDAATMEVTDKEISMTPDGAQRNTLSISKVSAAHSGMYYCASSSGRTSYGAALSFGSGTALVVLEKGAEIKPPKVSIYRPSKQEIDDHGFISLVCVASDFFPEHVKITWIVNGVERINLYEPVPQNRSDSSYSTSKRLTLTRSEYYNPESTFKCIAAFIDGNYSTSAEVKGETDCSISKETYTIHINQGKISYIMILCKSGLYALVVLALLWRKKVIASSY